MSKNDLVSVDESKTDQQRPETTSHKPTVLDIHGYKVGKTLGHGSYATVKEAYSSRHSTKVAIKIISKRRAPHDYLEKFLPREIEVVKLIKHPCLIIFLQSIETNNRVYLIMEHASKGDLLDAIRAKKYIKEKQAAIWFGQMIEGLDYCHGKGVVHRDLKCENVLLDDFNNLKITDFGFARSGMKPQANGRYPVSETYCGSYAYAAPEILTGTPYVPQLADIWSCGVILYVMVFGRLPFDDSNHKKLLKQVSSGPRFPENKDVSDDCKDLITKILRPSQNRYTIRDIKNHPWYMKWVPLEISTMSMRASSSKPPGTAPAKESRDRGAGNSSEKPGTSDKHERRTSKTATTTPVKKAASLH